MAIMSGNGKISALPVQGLANFAASGVETFNCAGGAGFCNQESVHTTNLNRHPGAQSAGLKPTGRGKSRMSGLPLGAVPSVAPVNC